jgi:hypothetical protein
MRSRAYNPITLRCAGGRSVVASVPTSLAPSDATTRHTSNPSKVPSVSDQVSVACLAYPVKVAAEQVPEPDIVLSLLHITGPPCRCTG